MPFIPLSTKRLSKEGKGKVQLLIFSMRWLPEYEESGTVGPKNMRSGTSQCFYHHSTRQSSTK